MMKRFSVLPALVVITAALAACGGPEQPVVGLVVDYPLDGSVFPPEIVAPTFIWHDGNEAVEAWQVDVEFGDGEPGLSLTVPGGPAPEPEIDEAALGDTNVVYEGTEYQQTAEHWTPTAKMWEEIKRRSVDRPATVTLRGREGDQEVSQASITISTSSDPVGAPIFYRDVPLMPTTGKSGTIQPLARTAIYLIDWRLRDLAKPSSRVVLSHMPSCANCHSFSRDGKTMGMDVDGPDGDKGSYMIAPVERLMTVTDEEVITWNSFTDKPEGHKTIGFLSRVSPDGRHVVTTLNESLFVQNFLDYRFLQVFYPTRGILGWYSAETEEIKALPGADHPDYVHCSPAWTPDGKWIIFSRAQAFDSTVRREDMPRYAGDPKEPKIRYDLYRMPFNDGKGGTPEPIEGASNNGMSNTFPKVSPDGKWIVYTKCSNGLLMRPDSRLWIIPAKGGEAREMNCNTPLMNSWHSFSPNSRWLVFSSKSVSPYTQLFLTHIDEDGHDTPAILIPNSTPANRASNLPEFLNAKTDAIEDIDIHAIDHHRRFSEAMEKSRLGKYEEAIALARLSLEEEPDFARARVLLGWSLHMVGKTEEGLKELRAVLKQDPQQGSAYYHLGLIAAQQGRPDEALQYYERAVDHGPENVEAWKSLGLAWLERDDTYKALTAYERALEIVPEDAEALESQAVVLLKRGRTGEALASLDKVCRLVPEDAETRTFLAWVLSTSPDEKLRRGERAVELAKEAVEITKAKSAPPLGALAAAYAETGQWSEAVENARRALALAKEQGLRDVPGYTQRLRLYEEKKPYRQPK